jgi:rhamnulose-1-phosphate aldolase
MRSIIDAPFMVEMRKTCDAMYNHGWNERNGGNASCLLSDEDVKECEKNLFDSGREFPLASSRKGVAGKYFLISGSGKYLKDILNYPEENLGIIKVSEDGNSFRVLWGLPNSKPTSEISMHLLCHEERLKQDPHHRVLLHNHATNVSAMTYVEELTDKAFSKSIWKAHTESIIALPEGIGVLPWMVCSSGDIAKATAEKMEKYRIVVWMGHGMMGAGRTFDEAFRTT